MNTGVEDEIAVLVVAGAALTVLSSKTTNLLLQIPHPWLTALHLHSSPRLQALARSTSMMLKTSCVSMKHFSNDSDVQ